MKFNDSNNHVVTPVFRRVKGYTIFSFLSAVYEISLRYHRASIGMKARWLVSEISLAADFFH